MSQAEATKKEIEQLGETVKGSDFNAAMVAADRLAVLTWAKCLTEEGYLAKFKGTSLEKAAPGILEANKPKKIDIKTLSGEDDKLLAPKPQHLSPFALRPPTHFETKLSRRKSSDEVLSTFQNTLKAINELGVECRLDIFHDRFVINHSTLATMENIDDACLLFRHEIAGRFGFEPSKDTMFDALRRTCLEHRFDPVLDYLSSVKWDGKPRLDTMLTVYFRAEDNPLNRAIGRKMMIAAVRRVMKPGCKFDYIVVMDNSAQGKGKSTAIEILAGSNNFSDSGLLDLPEQKQMEQIQGVWLYELGELAGLRRAEIERVKSFASRKTDRARPVYGKARVDRPRRCIFIGTTNDVEYLKDTTGNRRFWPFTPGDIDLVALKRDRDQLWAEAVVAEAKGESLVIPEELWPDAEERQQSRMTSHPWEEKLAVLEVIPTVQKVLNENGRDERRVSSDYILTSVLNIPSERWNESHGKTLKGLMNKLGWSGPEKMRIGGAAIRGYKKVV
jgi:hypothetical protein